MHPAKTQSATDVRTWPSVVLRLVVRGLPTFLLGAILSALLSSYFGIELLPDPQPIINLMDNEVQAGSSHDPGLLARIYTGDAVVSDAGCLARTQPVVWQGLPAIQERYQHLPAFASLQHVKVTIDWNSRFFNATAANVTGVTVGVLLDTTTPGPPVYRQITGYEAWRFVNTDSGWRIASFTYDLCAL